MGVFSRASLNWSGLLIRLMHGRRLFIPSLGLLRGSSQVSDQQCCLKAPSTQSCVSRPSSFTGVTYSLMSSMPGFIAPWFVVLHRCCFFLTNWRQAPPPIKKITTLFIATLTMLWWLEWNLQYLWETSGLATLSQCFLLHGIGAWKYEMRLLAPQCDIKHWIQLGSN